MANHPEKQIVLMSGLPGSMATLVALGVAKTTDLGLYNRALSSDRGYREQSGITIRDTDITLMPPSNHGSVIDNLPPGIITVDFTRPDVVNRNAELFAEAGVPFVMGTTGGDREKLLETVRRSKISAVVAPNMATPMVLVQAMLEYAAGTFPDALRDWELRITESHQTAKKDVSGTARAWQPLLEALGATMVGDITSKRDDPDPHAYHEVILRSADGNTEVELDTRIQGRSVYVGGTLQAVRFLAEKVRAGSQGEVFSMIDVLKG